MGKQILNFARSQHGAVLYSLKVKVSRIPNPLPYFGHTLGSNRNNLPRIGPIAKR